MSDTLASLVVKVGADISGYTKGLQDATAQLSSLSAGLEAMGEKLGELAGEFLAFEGMKKLAEESIEAAAGIEKTTIALTALTGSASIASNTIEKMESLASSEALSFPELLAASQHMTAIGLSLEQIEPALAAAGNAAWALGTNVSDVSSRMEGMALSGMASARQLKALGLSSDDLGKTLGVTADQAAKTFKALDETDRLTALTLAMGKFGDVATQEANATAGSWINVKNAWHEAAVTIGNDLLPLVKPIEDMAIGAAHVLELMVAIANAASHPTNLQAVSNAITASAKMAGGIKPGASNGIPADAETGYVGASKAANDLALAVRSITDAANDNLTPFGKAEENLQAVAQAYKFGAASSDELKAAQDAVTKAFMDANPTYQKWATSVEAGQQFAHGLALNLAEVARVNLQNFGTFIDQFEAGNMEAPALIDHVAKLTEGQKALDAISASVTKDLNYLNDAYKTLGLTMDGVSGDVSSRIIAAFDKIAIDNTTTVDGIEQAWGKASGAIDKLAKTDLPAAIAQYDTYIATLQSISAPLADIYAAQEKELQLEIQIDELRGDSATRQIVQLTNLQTRMQSLATAANNLGNMYKGIVKDVQDFTGSLGNTLSAGIFSGDIGKSIGDAVKKSMQSVLGTVFQAGINKLLAEMGFNTAAQALGAASINTGTAATVAHTGVLGAHMGVLGAHLGVMTAHLGVMFTHLGALIASTIATIEQTIATIALKVVMIVKSIFGFAEGGRPPVGRPSIVGEKGPELFMPDHMGTIIPNDMLHAMAARVPSNWVPDYMDLSSGGGYSAPSQGLMSGRSSTGGAPVVMYNSFPNVKTTRQAAGELARYLKTAGGPAFSPAS
ncbi:MAG TPA: hypothetical protein VHZ74_13895 [Bryobacteraceae bacterium]|jgi:hypothetical protein|nr:hypothetical protein [Bryobacteraceae bacterium]